MAVLVWTQGRMRKGCEMVGSKKGQVRLRGKAREGRLKKNGRRQGKGKGRGRPGKAG